MENLQPIIKHRFWILFGVAMLMIPVGWWLGTGSIASESKKRLGEIKSAENGIPAGSEHPNKDYIENLKKRNEIRASYHHNHHVALYRRQQSLQSWPANIEKHFKNIPYLGKIPPTVCSIYRDAYFRDSLDRLHKIVDPVELIYKDGNYTGKYRGKVVFDKKIIPQVPYDTWARRLPESDELWEAQEDVWLLTALLKAIARVNQDATRIDDAPIRLIWRISLHGGTPASEDGETTQSSSSDGDGSGAPGGTGSGEPGYSVPMGGSGSDAAGGSGTGSGVASAGVAAVNIDPKEVFGPEQPRKTEGGDGESGSESDGSGSGAPGGAPPIASPSYNPGSASGTGGTSGNYDENGRTKNSPYIDNNPDLPFKTRGFIIGVLMKRRDIIHLQRELGRMSFPVEIRRVLYIDRDTDLRGLSITGGLGAGQSGGFAPGAESGPMGPGPMGVGGLGASPTPGSGLGSSSGSGSGSGFPGASIPMPMGGSNGYVPPGSESGLTPMGGGTVPGARGATTSTAPYAAALTDTGLAYVSIAGLMTIYQPPKPIEKEDATGTKATGNSQTTPPAKVNSSKSTPQTNPVPNTQNGTTPAKNVKQNTSPDSKSNSTPSGSGNQPLKQPMNSKPTSPSTNSPATKPGATPTKKPS